MGPPGPKLLPKPQKKRRLPSNFSTSPSVTAKNRYSPLLNANVISDTYLATSSEDIMVKNVCVSELVWGIRLGIDGFRCAVHVDINRIDGDQHDRATLKTLTRLGTDMHSVIF
ncbi:hypothetical protein QTP88_017116 [Uroleucon formosanum]